MSRERQSRRGLAIALAVFAGLILLPSVASAQQVRNPAPPVFDVTFGAGMTTAIVLGEADANLRASNQTVTNYRLFSTDTTLRPSPVVDVKVAGSVTRRVAVEGQVHVAKPELRTVISDDVESAPDLTVTERLTEFLVAGGVRLRLDDPRRQARTMPHLSAGAGVIRQTHEDGTGIDPEPLFYVGAGVRHALAVRPGEFPRLGIRADVQWLMVKSGLSVDDRLTPQLAVTAGVFLAF